MLNDSGSQRYSRVCILAKAHGNHLSSHTFLRGRSAKKVEFPSLSYRRPTNLPNPDRPLDLAKVAELKFVMSIFVYVPTDSNLERSSPISSNSPTYPAMSCAYTQIRSLNNNIADAKAPTFAYLLRPSFLRAKMRSTSWFLSLQITRKEKRSSPGVLNKNARMRVQLTAMVSFSAGLSAPPAMTFAQMKKLTERRDERFTCAVNE